MTDRVRAPAVVKLGGSLMAGADLHAWCSAVARAGRARRIAVVAGGGRFADAVRAAQTEHAFDDDSAHDMALLAMAQFAHMLCGSSPTARAALTPAACEGFADVWARGRVPLWTPDPAMLARVETIERGWHVTSDSLAAWLARTLCATELVLVKSVPREALAGGLEALTGSGAVDPGFARLAADARLTLHLLGASEHGRLGTVLGGPA